MMQLKQNLTLRKAQTMQVDLKEKTKLFSQENKCEDFDEDCDEDICATSCWLYQPERGWCPLLYVPQTERQSHE